MHEDGTRMISRGEIRLIAAGVGIYAEALSIDINKSIIIMVSVTTIKIPLLLKRAYQRYYPQQNSFQLKY